MTHCCLPSKGSCNDAEYLAFTACKRRNLLSCCPSHAAKPPLQLPLSHGQPSSSQVPTPRPLPPTHYTRFRVHPPACVCVVLDRGLLLSLLRLLGMPRLPLPALEACTQAHPEGARGQPSDPVPPASFIFILPPRAASSHDATRWLGPCGRVTGRGRLLPPPFLTLLPHELASFLNLGCVVVHRGAVATERIYLQAGPDVCSPPSPHLSCCMCCRGFLTALCVCSQRRPPTWALLGCLKGKRVNDNKNEGSLFHSSSSTVRAAFFVGVGGSKQKHSRNKQRKRGSCIAGRGRGSCIVTNNSQLLCGRKQGAAKPAERAESAAGKGRQQRTRSGKRQVPVRVFVAGDWPAAAAGGGTKNGGPSPMPAPARDTAQYTRTGNPSCNA